MKTPVRQKIVIIGCGNVAWHIAKKLQSLKKFEILVYNHKPNPALKDFKNKLGCKVFSTLEGIEGDASYYIISVTDKYIRSAAEKINIKNPNALLMHVSGSAAIEDLGERVHHTGIIYPLQTFSKSDAIQWEEVPLVLEANQDKTREILKDLASLFSNKITFADKSQRLRLHLAAVFVNNFTNSMYVAAEKLIKKGTKKADYLVLIPLMEQTVSKVKKIHPLKAQTGPAKRGDEIVMKKHLKLLSEEPELKKIYKQLSKLIAKQQKTKYAKF
jgi:predicted short-subunit dehydrogenase-like oxidoreductase (DUF2520 family)